MNFCIRPSKSFLFDILEKELNKFTSGIGLDAASESMKNRKMFKTDVYYGLDIDLSKLQNGLMANKANDTFGILADITKLGLLPANSVDVVVSSNTLYKLTPADREQAIKNLSEIVSPRGYFLCDFPLDDKFGNIEHVLKLNFKKVKIVFLRNTLSQAYERFLGKNNWLGYNSIGGSKFFRILSWLISRTEFITCGFSSLNNKVFAICADKNDFNKKNEFDLSALTMADERVYNALS